uniref:Putative secreted protein n=1 Tax=Ixodes ricinus TaxID=34613 RepID=A0A6B0UTA1_IXORI
MARIRFHLLVQQTLCLPHILDGACVVLISTMGEIQPGNVHASLHHVNQHRHILRSRADGAYDARESHERRRLVDVQVAQVLEQGVGVDGVHLGRLGHFLRHGCFFYQQISVERSNGSYQRLLPNVVSDHCPASCPTR